MGWAVRAAAALSVAAVVWAGGRKSGALGPTRMVKLNVEVEDRRGRPVSGLAAEDFHVYDQGRPQKIVRFRTEEGRGKRLELRAGEGEVSNRSAEAPPHVTLILFDLLNTNMDDQGFARGRIIGALKKLEPAEYVYLYLLTIAGLIPLEGLPAPGEEAPAKAEEPWTREIQQRLDSAMKSVNRLGPQHDNLFPLDRVNMTYSAIEGLLGRLGAVAGRKNLVWITHGVPVEIGEQHPEWGEPADYRPMLRELSAAMERSGVAVYPVELYGPQREASAAVLANVETLREIAAMTGGEVYVDAEVGEAIGDAVRSTRSSYRIGYYPPPESWDGKMHRIRVKCLRKGARVVARTEYAAYPPEAASEAEETAALRGALGSPFDASEIAVAGEAEAAGGEARRVQVRLQVGAQDLTLLPVGERYLGGIAVTYVEYGAGGRPKALSGSHERLDLSSRQREELMSGGIRLRSELSLDADVSKLRAIIFDDYSGAVGSVTFTGLRKGQR